MAVLARGDISISLDCLADFILATRSGEGQANQHSGGGIGLEGRDVSDTCHPSTLREEYVKGF